MIQYLGKLFYYIPPMTSLDKNLEKKLWETHYEEGRERDVIAKTFKESPEGKKLQNILVKELKWKVSEDVVKKLFERIATTYSNKKPSERENIAGIVEEVCQDWDNRRSIWLPTEVIKDPQFMATIKKEYIGGNSENQKKPNEKEKTEQTNAYDSLPGFAKTPEFDTLERLVEQGHISEKDFEEFKKENAKSDEKTLQANMQKLVSNIKDEETKRKIHKQFFWETNKEESKKGGKEEKEVKTADDIKGTDFYKDWGNLINEDRQISDFELKIARNYLSIKDVSGKWENKKDDLSAALATTWKQIITEQNPEFKQVNAKDIEIALNKNEDIEKRYQAIERLYNKSEAVKGKNQKATERNQRGNQAQQKVEQQQQQFAEGQKAQIETARSQQANLSRQELARQEADEQARELAQAWDIAQFQWGKLDVWPQWKESPSKTA